MKKNFFLQLTSVMLLLTLFACSSNEVKETKEVKVQEMVSFSKEKQNTLKVISDSPKVKVIVNAIRQAKKQKGIVDITDLQYRLDTDQDRYYLWFNENGPVIIMNDNDKNTIFKIADAKDLENVIK
ncbi:hypothetical protein [Rummeliibacillus stabekisii]|uniref:YhfM-like domain-containing protein n=1 Tax=Rummeliibacillus stabekisii TaxID=241244 RepID=A0A143HGF0_9BACL|nr:hypothetical protein [Rummeliibacillus stabekisii]AMX00818.1 hypothetical protein ATY39_16395 [Rummeliibacillus stabekisii]